MESLILMMQMGMESIQEQNHSWMRMEMVNGLFLLIIIWMEYVIPHNNVQGMILLIVWMNVSGGKIS
jgi:hypothetical protein